MGFYHIDVFNHKNNYCKKQYLIPLFAVPLLHIQYIVTHKNSWINYLMISLRLVVYLCRHGRYIIIKEIIRIRTAQIISKKPLAG